ncbi:MAG: hypothetical protein IT319_01560, partial [Anaerolineae bacterium]|nr:hypothetical protein [Anaerolineae bacterium]
LALGDIGSFDAGNGQTVTRTGDVVIISGSGGNGAGPGSKWFSLSECIARNGGTPELPPLPPNNPPPVQNTEPAADTEDAGNNVWLCLPGAESVADFIRCLDFFAPDNAGADYFYGIFWAIVTFCAGGFAPAAVVALPAFRVWRRRRKT